MRLTCFSVNGAPKPFLAIALRNKALAFLSKRKYRHDKTGSPQNNQKARYPPGFQVDTGRTVHLRLSEAAKMPAEISDPPSQSGGVVQRDTEHTAPA